MKRLSLISLTLMVASAGSVSSWAGRLLPSNDFFTDGQSWEIERVAAENTSQASILEVRVAGTVMAEGQYTDKYGTYTISEQCARLVVSENGVQTGEFAAVEIYGKILLYSEKKSAFVPVLDFTCTEGEKVALGDDECNVTRVNYIYPGDILRKKVSGYIGDRTGEYVFGFGAKEYSLSPEYWDGAGSYRTVSMTAANGVTLTDNIFDQAGAETSNEYWTEGKSWAYRHFYPSFPEQEDYYTYQIVKGDTEVNHLPCRKLFNCDESWNPLYASYTAVCDIDGQVYQYSDAHQRFILRLDFNIGVGTEAIPGMEASGVVAENRVQANGRVFDRIVFAGAEDDSEWAYWVKGVGASGPNDIANMPLPPDGSIYRLDACYEDGQKIFSFADFSLPAYYVPMIRQDRSWQYYGTEGWKGSVFHTMRFTGEVEYNGKVYSVFSRTNTKIYRTDSETQERYLYSNEDFTDNGLKYFVREEEGKTYALAYFSDPADLTYGTIFYTKEPASESLFESIEKGVFADILIYDTTLPDRSFIELPPMPSFGALENFMQIYGDPIEIDGESCKFGSYVHEYESEYYGDWKPTLSGNFPDTLNNCWIEGVGILRTGCLAAYEIDVCAGQGYDNTEFLTQDSWLFSVYTDDGRILYGEPPYGVGISTISDDASPEDNRMFDLMGREITAPVSGTVYIRDGKKFVAK